MNFLHHLFVPREANNYRSGLLHHKVLLNLILVIVAVGLLTGIVRTNFPSVLGIASDISVQQLLILTNQQREGNSLAPLSNNPELDQAAYNKAADMFAKDYWAHNAPDGTTPWVFIKGAGYNYVYAGENLARGFSNASDVVTAWMNSQEHRKNILSSNYRDVGFAVATGKLNGEDTVLVVEMLGSRSFGTVAVENNKQPVEIAVASISATNLNNTNTEPSPAPEPESSILSQQLLGISSIKPFINSQKLTAISAGAILALFIFVLLIDMVIVERKKVVRFVGHNLDHILFLSAIFGIVLIFMKGSII